MCELLDSSCTVWDITRVLLAKRAQHDSHLIWLRSCMRAALLPVSCIGQLYDESCMTKLVLRACSRALLPWPLPTAPFASTWPHLHPCESNVVSQTGPSWNLVKTAWSDDYTWLPRVKDYTYTLAGLTLVNTCFTLIIHS